MLKVQNITFTKASTVEMKCLVLVVQNKVFNGEVHIYVTGICLIDRKI